MTEQILVLPPEIWKQILLNLNERELMPCRSVNRGWRVLSSQVLFKKSSIWKPTFEPLGEVLKGRHATHFSTVEGITRFCSELKGASTPFPNGTVIFNPGGECRKEQVIYDKFCELLDIFKDGIVSLVFTWFVQENPKALFILLPSILKLKNLKSLIIEPFNSGTYNAWDFLCGNRGQNLLDEMLKKRNLAIREKLTELHILGRKGGIPLSFIFGGITPIIKSITSLEVSNTDQSHLFFDELDDADVKLSKCQFPFLRKLKVHFPDAKFLKQFCQFQPNCVASLREVSLNFHIRQMHTLSGRTPVRETFALLDYHADTLEVLSLYFDSFDWNKWIMYEDLEDLGEPATSVKYTKVKTLFLHYDVIYHWPTIIRHVIKKVVNLQELKLFAQDYEDAKLKKIPKRQHFQKVLACWDVLPATVKVIHFPHFGWKVGRGAILKVEDDKDESAENSEEA